MRRWTGWLPLMLLAGALFWTTALGLGLRSLQAFTGRSRPGSVRLIYRSGAAPVVRIRQGIDCPGFVGGTSGIDVSRAETPFGQTAW